MKPIEFPEQNTVVAEDQPEYLDLPGLRHHNVEGELITCWSLSWRERFKVLFSGCVWLNMWTFNKPVTPVRLSVDKADMNLLVVRKVG